MEKKIYEVIYYVSNENEDNMFSNNLNTIIFNYNGEQAYRDQENRIVQTYSYIKNENAPGIMRLIETNLIRGVKPINNYTIASSEQSVVHITPVYDLETFNKFENMNILYVSSYKCRSNAIAFNEAVNDCRSYMFRNFQGNYEVITYPALADFGLTNLKKPENIIIAKVYLEKYGHRLFDENGILKPAKYFNGDDNRENLLDKFGFYIGKLFEDEAKETKVYEDYDIPTLSIKKNIGE